MLSLHCSTQAFSSCGEQGILFVVVHRLLIVVVSLVAAHGLWSAGLVAVAHWPSCPMASALFPDQGSKDPLHWQTDLITRSPEKSQISFVIDL